MKENPKTREVSYNEANNFAMENKIFFKETSAYENVDDIFEKIVESKNLFYFYKN